MSKFKLKSSFDAGDYLSNTTTKKFEAETLDEVFWHFTEFLKGIGYVFEGEVGIVKEKSAYDEIESLDSDQLELDFEEKK